MLSQITIFVTHVTTLAIAICYDKFHKHIKGNTMASKTPTIKLDVYISDDCWTCEETRNIITEITSEFPAVDIACIDLQKHSAPTCVFATPTYVLNDKVIYMGNPTREELKAKLHMALTTNPVSTL